MASYEGDIMRPPGFSGPEVVYGSEELMYALGAGVIKKGGLVAQGTGVYKVGEPVKYDATNGVYVKATAADVQGFVYKATDTTSSARQINVILGGTIKSTASGLGSLDRAAIAATLNGTYNEALGFINF